MLRVGILTSGGDCQGLNAAISGVVNTLYHALGKQVTVYGIEDGYTGLIYGDYKKMQQSDFADILGTGGTILGTSRQPFKTIRNVDELGVDKVASMKNHYKAMKLDCLVILGGNGTHKTANLLREEGLNVVTLPKTIDNDLWGTDMTFGFHSALEVATDALNRISTTASSHSRIFLVEIMGHKAGWLTLEAGLASGADMILLPEIPYSPQVVARDVEACFSEGNGRSHAVIAVAEGALSIEEAAMSGKEFKAVRAQMPYPSVAYKIADELAKTTQHEIRVAIPGHIQRGGDPCPYDRVLATQLGTAAGQLILEKQYGNMVALQNGRIVPVPLSEVAGKLKTVPRDAQSILAGKALGVSFGDCPESYTVTRPKKSKKKPEKAEKPEKIEKTEKAEKSESSK